MSALLDFVDRFGYLGVGGLVFVESFGVPAPGETAIIAGSAAAGSGHLNIFAVAAVAFVAAVAGDSLGYLIGRTGGHALILRFGRYVRLTPERLHRVERFMNKQGSKIVVVARFVEGLRQLNGVVAGMTGMPWPRFFLFNTIGAALWVGCWSAAGYLAGNHLEQLSHYLTLVILVAAAIICGYAVFHLRRRRKHRAEAAEAATAVAAVAGEDATVSAEVPSPRKASAPGKAAVHED
jgi:membrane protein DedA with SNARE-associated domain